MLKNSRRFAWWLAVWLCFSGAPGFAGELPPSCNTDCVTPYGEVLGRTADGTRSFSNCKAACVVFDPNRDEQGRYTGIRWQCVEFARRWLVQNRGVSFGDVDVAADIWDKVDHFSRVSDGREEAADNYPNGSAVLPQQGDLLIYAREFLGTGHAAVVTAVDSAKGKVAVAEQNFKNQKWPGHYARNIEFIERHGHYWLLDGYLLGWKHMRR
ncbi:MAG: CHAP domain-containing protein [Sulfuricellaceae bacterium]|nr:CHAP domain-containing protein [Sulfuricellaceae bacterium]